jgi:uncharacterized membrane protein YfcA
MIELTLPLLFTITIAGLIVGTLIGSIGVGGILMVPVLVYIAGIDIHTAIASCMFSYAFNGLAGAWLYARRGSINWRDGLWLCLGAMPGAVIGALLILQLNPQWAALVIALFIVFSALSARRGPTEDTASQPPVNHSRALLRAGLATGAGSALSGSGGPLVLIPILGWMRWPVLAAIGQGQLIQIPISLLATATNWHYGTLSLPLGLCIAASVSVGVTLGAGLAHSLPATLLRQLVIAALVLVAVWMLIQALWGIVDGYQLSS